MRQGRRHFLTGPTQGHKTHEMPGFSRRRFDAEEDMGRSELFGFDGDDTKRPRPPASQHTGGGIGVVAQRGDGAFRPADGSRRLPRGIH